ncbi:response regulator transcription factor [Dyella sp.]|uniref:response regulator transcription factor n=1 Tax=Dyella sp. TaxID=1869338 RepID=UPI002B48B127|nr:response regulator transcription factor [Dyella sp.]HKT27451.1 response regulator transcription factor [Dyella sp.]
MKKITVGVADDHPIVVLGVVHLLQSSPDIEVRFTAERIEDLFKQLAEKPVDVLLCDYEFRDDPHADGFQLIERLRRLAPETRIMLFSSHTSAYVVSSTLQAGISGFVGKQQGDFANLPYAIRALSHERFFLSASLQNRLFHTMDGRFENLGKAGRGSARPGGLSDKEAAVARLICEGLSLVEIAQRLKRSPKTISNQKNAAMKKLGARNDVELSMAMRNIDQVS